MSDCLYFLRYWVIIVLHFFVNQAVILKTKIIYLIKPFFYPSKHLLVLKTSSARLQHNNFTSSKMSCKDVLKTSWRHVLKRSWRQYGDKQNTYWGYLYITNLNLYLTNLHLTNLHLVILRRIQNALSRTHHFNICLILELKQHLYFKN